MKRTDPERSPTKQAKIINQVVSPNRAKVQNDNPRTRKPNKPGRSQKNRNTKKTDGYR